MPAIVSPYPFVSLADFKTRLKISNATEDDLLSQILEMVSDTLELVGAGRRLRRLHRQREVFNGGERLIRVRTYPIAKIHSIRESSTRDFETSGSYTELTEGTDYVLESDYRGESPGESGWIRRLDGDWMGDNKSPGQIEVVYTGGYETPDEVANHNRVYTISDSDRIIDFGMTSINEIAQAIVDDESEEITMTPSITVTTKGFLRVDLRELIPASVEISKVTLSLGGRIVTGAGSTMQLNVVQLAGDPRLQAVLQTVFDLDDDANSQAWANNLGPYNNVALEALTAFADSTDANWAAIQSAMLETREDGEYLAFSYTQTGLNPIFGDEGFVGAIENTSGPVKPIVTIRTGLAFNDNFRMPRDLQQACILQSIHEYKQRTNPGLRQRTQRGVAIASGHAIMKDPVNLLPEVERILAAYRDYY
jgi:hypothetical protein